VPDSAVTVGEEPPDTDEPPDVDAASRRTVTVPLIEWCSLQKNWNFPTSLNVNEKVLFWRSSGLSHLPDGLSGVPAVVVCCTRSRFCQTTFVPTGTVTLW
jgi:hypothetical protein